MEDYKNKKDVELHLNNKAKTRDSIIYSVSKSLYYNNTMLPIHYLKPLFLSHDLPMDFWLFRKLQKLENDGFVEPKIEIEVNKNPKIAKLIEKIGKKKIFSKFETFQFYSNLQRKVSFTSYAKGINFFLPIITKVVSIERFIFSKKELGKFLIIGRHIEKVCLNNCILNFEDIKFPNQLSYGIVELELNRSSLSGDRNCKRNSIFLGHLIRAISESPSLKKSLKYVHIQYSKIPKRTWDAYLNRHQLLGIKFSGSNNGSDCYEAFLPNPASPWEILPFEISFRPSW